MGVGVGRIIIIREIMESMTSTLSSENINGKELKVFKVLILGDSGTGKTALVRRSVHDFFTEGYRSTIGVDFSLKVLRWSEDLEIAREKLKNCLSVQISPGNQLNTEYRRQSTAEYLPYFHYNTDLEKMMP